jgi:hypothetical protein
VKKILSIILTATLTLSLLLTGVIPVYAYSNPLNMQCFSVSGYWCGPSSGVSIGRYYDQTYTYLPGAGTNYNAMYDRLYTYMATSILGSTGPEAYGQGFVEMALHYGYDNFSYDLVHPVSDGSWSTITSAINNGWPVALMTSALYGFTGVPALYTDGSSSWPCPSPHWIAIKGYTTTWPGHSRVIICTDSYSHANTLDLDWGQLYATLSTTLWLVTIKNLDDPDPYGPYVEDFEWGTSGASLSTSGGEVKWSVITSGGSVAQIYTGQSHTGTKSARISRGSSGVAEAFYRLREPSYIRFWLKKDDTAVARIMNANGSYDILVEIDSAEQLRYYDGTWHNVCTLSPATWYQIYLYSISWVAHTYSIGVYDTSNHVIGAKTTAQMDDECGYNGCVYFETLAGSGGFWIDDITDSLR